MKLLIRWCLGNRLVVVLLSLVLMAAGVAGLLRINQELLPSVQLPTVFILVPEPGASSEQVDRDVAQPLTAALSDLPGKTHISTTATQGFAQVNIVFDLNSSVKDDLDAVNQRLQHMPLPPSVQPPMVHVSNVATDAPVMIYSLAARDGDLARLTAEANDAVVPALSGAAGASRVT